MLDKSTENDGLATPMQESEKECLKGAQIDKTKFKANEQVGVRIVSTYVPHVNKKHSHLNVYSQQQDALLSMGITSNPLTVFWNNFWKMIDEALEVGEQLIIAGDWNTDIQENSFKEKFRQQNLVPAITGTHGDDGPGTYLSICMSLFVPEYVEISRKYLPTPFWYVQK